MNYYYVVLLRELSVPETISQCPVSNSLHFKVIKATPIMVSNLVNSSPIRPKCSFGSFKRYKVTNGYKLHEVTIVQGFIYHFFLLFIQHIYTNGSFLQSTYHSMPIEIVIEFFFFIFIRRHFLSLFHSSSFFLSPSLLCASIISFASIR